MVVPAHNEEGLLVDAVGEMVAGLRSRGPFELIVVENGSTDSTAALAAKMSAEVDGVRHLSLPDADYGKALRSGFLAAKGDYVTIFDVDYFDMDFLDRALALMGGDGAADIVVGTKRGEGAVDGRSRSRRLVTALFSTILRLGFGLKVSDTHGMKLIRREKLVPVAEVCRFGTDLFDTELILRAQRAGLAVTEVPVVVNELRPSRSSILSRIPRTVAGLARLRWALWRG